MVFFLVYCASFFLLNGLVLSTQEWHSYFAVISMIFVVLLAQPVFVMFSRAITFQRATPLLLSLGAFAFFLESFATATGFPYSGFVYGAKMGVTLLGIPITLPFAWLPLLLASYALAQRFTSGFTIPIFVCVYYGCF